MPADTYWVQIGSSDGGSGPFQVEFLLSGYGADDSGSNSRSGAVIDSESCTATELSANDNGSTARAELPFTLDFYGRSYNSLYVNNNGNVTFDAALGTFTPFPLSGTNRAIVAPFFGDVDTRSPTSDTVKYGYGETLFEGRPAFCVNWVDVGYYAGHYDKSNSFQLLLVDRSDLAPGGFDIVFNYDRIQWETGDASGGRGGLGGNSARAGFSNGTGTVATSYELPGSAVNGGLLDSNAGTGLAVNSQSSDQTGRYVYAVRNGNPTCAGDADCDGLSDSVERYAGTSLTDADTDGDGLKDAWEVDPKLAGAGIRMPNGITVDRDDVFGPYGGYPCIEGVGVDSELRPQGQYTCLNKAPDPRQKDMYLEIDWQDCTVAGCPEVLRDSEDTLHHPERCWARSGCRHVRQGSGQQPQRSQRGAPERAGGRKHSTHAELHPSHRDSNLDRPGFGTADQRKSNAHDVLAAKNMVVRYMWSGHSAAHAETGGTDPCPDPRWYEFAGQGLGLADLASYDYSPFGDVRVGGSYMVASLGVLWNCPSAIGTDTVYNIPVMSGSVGPCFRETEANQYNVNISDVVDPGIFPARIDAGSQDSKDWRWPVSRLMGQDEADAGEQLWSRTLSHLLGHSLGLASDSAVRNQPAPAGRKQSGHTHPLTPLPADTYASWSGLSYAPNGRGGARTTEAYPNYDQLARTSLSLSDPDSDGWMEHDDNCPGVWNPDQSNSDTEGFNGHNTSEFGDACDPDIDGDGQRNPTPGRGELSVASGGRMPGSMAAAAVSELDPMPYDTNDDGEDNAVDLDDDGDGVDDLVDNCRISLNPTQSDLDADGAGNPCDIDADGDGEHNNIEISVGSDPLGADSTPEYAGVDGSCSNGRDDDGDGAVDATDVGCVDGDGDGWADTDDRCSTVSDVGNADRDGDGIGDVCDQIVRISGLETGVVDADSPGTRLSFWATQSGPWTLRSGSDDCASGTVLAEGHYTATQNRLDPSSVIVPIPTALLAEGATELRVCVTGDGGQDSDITTALRDTVLAQVSAPRLQSSDDTGTSTSDAITRSETLTVTGTADTGSLLTIRRDGVLLTQSLLDASGEWSWTEPEPLPEGRYTYEAEAIDPSGNPATASTTVVVDRTAPALVITAGPAEGGTSEAQATFALDAGEPVDVECRLDGGAWQPCASPHTVRALRVGSHALELRATDLSGNVQTEPTVRSWRVVYTFSGFFDPVESAPALNSVKAGASVPVKFTLGSDAGLDVLAPASPASVTVSCGTTALLELVQDTVTAGQSGLQYDATTGVYTYVWKTDRAWAGTCRQFRLVLSDGTSHSFLVKLR